MSEINNYLAGVGIAMCSTLCSAIGLVCQKLTHKRMEAATGAGGAKPRYFTSPLWWGGIGAMVCGAVMSFAVFNFLGQSRASAMASITIVWNGVLAALFLGERFSLFDALVTGIIITGASLAVVFGSVGAASQSSADIAGVVAQLSRTLAIVAGVVIAVIWLAVYLFVRRVSSLGAARTRNQVRLECYCRIFLSGIMTGEWKALRVCLPGSCSLFHHS